MRQAHLNLTERKDFGKRSLDWTGKKSTFIFEIHGKAFKGMCQGGWKNEQSEAGHTYIRVDFMVRPGQMVKVDSPMAAPWLVHGLPVQTLHSWENAFYSIHLAPVASEFVLSTPNPQTIRDDSDDILFPSFGNLSQNLIPEKRLAITFYFLDSCTGF